MVGTQEGCTESRSHGVPDLRKKCEIFHVNVSVKVNVYLYSIGKELATQLKLQKKVRSEECGKGDFPGSPVVKTQGAQFDPWSGN